MELLNRELICMKKYESLEAAVKASENDEEEEYEEGGSWFDGEVESGGRLVREYFFGGLSENTVEKNKNMMKYS